MNLPKKRLKSDAKHCWTEKGNPRSEFLRIKSKIEAVVEGRPADYECAYAWNDKQALKVAAPDK